ncbi:MAG: response regulator [Pedobacter sp.]
MLTDNNNAPLILIVEDNDLHVSAIQSSFENAENDYRLAIVGTVNDALTVMALQVPDLVITDYKLPDGDGTWLLIVVNGQCPVILMTSQDREHVAVNAIKAGAQDYIVKSPAAFAALPLTVKYALANWKFVVARRQADESVYRAKRDWEMTFDAVPDLISIIDTNHTIIRVNLAMADRCGLMPKELVGRKCHELMHGASDPHVSCPHVRLIQDGFGHTEQIEEKLLNGVFDITVSPLHNAEGQLSGCVHVARDVTERKRAEEERLAFDQQFQQTQKLESLGVLAGGIAHDFNNILTIILGHCYIVDQDIDSGMDQKTHVKHIEKAAGRAAELCRHMLAYAGQNELVQTRINLWLLVDENVKMLRSAIKKNVNFELDLKYDVPEISGDSAQIQQVVMNLIINAAEAIGDENGTINITLKKTTVSTDQADKDFWGNAIHAGNYACLTVSDSGCGMTVETQKRIFEPFYTTKFTGRGLGMSVVLGIIKSHDGSLQLSSMPGVGTTFKIFLPLTAVPDILETKLTFDSVSSVKARGAILLVDDEEELRIIGTSLLKAMGYSVMIAPDGREALEIYHEQRAGIDLILLDLLMPEMGGVHMYRRLREISPSLPIIVCSGYSVEEILEDIYSDKYSAVIQKPYNPDQLRNTLMKLLDMTE